MVGVGLLTQAALAPARAARPARCSDRSWATSSLAEADTQRITGTCPRTVGEQLGRWAGQLTFVAPGSLGGPAPQDRHATPRLLRRSRVALGSWNSRAAWRGAPPCSTPHRGDGATRGQLAVTVPARLHYNEEPGGLRLPLQDESEQMRVERALARKSVSMPPRGVFGARRFDIDGTEWRRREACSPLHLPQATSLEFLASGRRSLAVLINAAGEKYLTEGRSSGAEVPGEGTASDPKRDSGDSSTKTKKPPVSRGLLCAQEGIRTLTPRGASPSSWCVYQFHHLGIFMRTDL